MANGSQEVVVDREAGRGQSRVGHLRLLVLRMHAMLA